MRKSTTNTVTEKATKVTHLTVTFEQAVKALVADLATGGNLQSVEGMNDRSTKIGFLRIEQIKKLTVVPKFQRNHLEDPDKTSKEETAQLMFASLLVRLGIAGSFIIMSNENGELELGDGLQRKSSHALITDAKIAFNSKYAEKSGLYTDEQLDYMKQFNSKTIEDIENPDFKEAEKNDEWRKIAASIRNLLVPTIVYIGYSEKERRAMFNLVNTTQKIVNSDERKKSSYIGTPLYDVIRNIAETKISPDGFDYVGIMGFDKSNLREQMTNYFGQLAVHTLYTSANTARSKTMKSLLEDMYSGKNNCEEIAENFSENFKAYFKIIQDNDLTGVVNRVKLTTTGNTPVNKKFLFKTLFVFAKENEEFIEKYAGKYNFVEILEEATSSEKYTNCKIAKDTTNGTGSFGKPILMARLWRKIIEKYIDSSENNKRNYYTFDKWCKEIVDNFN